MKRFLYEKRRILCPLSAFIIPVAVMVFISILSGFYPFGHTSILMADMRYQFVDYFGYMKQIFFSNDTYFYSFSKTFGGDMAGLAAYYCNNPFLVFLLFVPNDLLPGGILILQGFTGADILHSSFRRLMPLWDISWDISTAYSISSI